MTLDYSPIPMRAVGPGATLRRATPASGERLTLDSRALSVMTDFAVVPAATVEPGASIADANAFMIRRGVRSLLVVDHGGRFVGIVTAADILGERPMQIAVERKVGRAEIRVEEVMTPVDRVEAVAMDALLDARVGHIVATLQRAGRQHTLVIERADGGPVVRGVFSLSHIAAELGVTIEPAAAVAESFADIEAALAR